MDKLKKIQAKFYGLQVRKMPSKLILVLAVAGLVGCKQEPKIVRVIERSHESYYPMAEVSIDALKPGVKIMITSPNYRNEDGSIFGRSAIILSVHRKLLHVKFLDYKNPVSNSDIEDIFLDDYDLEIEI